MLPTVPMAIGAGLGAIGGLIKRGPKISLSHQGQQALGISMDAMNAYRNLTSSGPGASDVTAALNATRGYADQLNNISSRSEGLYDMARGNQLAAQAFGAQRMALNQSFQDQMQQANRAASAAGRSSNDPILRARMLQEQSRQQAMLSAQQSAAAVDFGRQATTDMLTLQGQRVDALSGLSQQAFGNQQNLFNMGNQVYQNEWNRAMQTAQYEQSRGGGLSGAITGLTGGLAAGFNVAQGMQNSDFQQKQAGIQNDLQAQAVKAMQTAASRPMTPMMAPTANPAQGLNVTGLPRPVFEMFPNFNQAPVSTSPQFNAQAPTGRGFMDLFGGSSFFGP